MRKVFHFDPPRENYICDAAVVWCFDNRFTVTGRKFLKQIGVINYDSIRIAGGAKSLVSPEHDSDREFVFRQIRTSMRVHETKRVILMLHSDCRTYGGLAEAFGGDARLEAQRLEAELRGAAECLRKEIPGLDVHTYFADFEGVWEVDGAAG
jgi:hypothetical protein